MWFDSVEGLHAIVVTDRDGVPIIKGTLVNTKPLFILAASDL